VMMCCGQAKFFKPSSILQPMKAVVVNYRRGRHTQNPHQMILKAEGVDTKEAAEKLKGRQAVWTSPAGKQLTGTVLGAHGNKGALRARFETGLPGQAIGTPAEIL